MSQERASKEPRTEASKRWSAWWAQLETQGGEISDSLLGFRVYPIAPLVAVMVEARPWMRRYDVDLEAAARLHWRGVPSVNLPAPVRYLRAEEGSVSHFPDRGRDNALLTWMHCQLALRALVRLPALLRHRQAG
jgi:hypothetical protein